MVPILFMGARLAHHYKSIGVSGKQTHKVQRIGHGPCRVSGPRKKKKRKESQDHLPCVHYETNDRAVR